MDRDPASLESVRDAITRWLAASAAEYVVLNLEDLWLEVLPQNTPGTTTERPNWIRKLRHSLETLGEGWQFGELLNTVNRLRRGWHDPPNGVPRPLSIHGHVPSTAEDEDSI
jgi:4-alpha-glucanotransferase